MKLDFVFLGEGTPADGGNRGRRQDGYTAIKDAEDDAVAGPPVGAVQARIPSSTTSRETRLRIDFYRRLALAANPAALRQIEADLQGPLRQVRRRRCAPSSWSPRSVFGRNKRGCCPSKRSPTA